MKKNTILLLALLFTGCISPSINQQICDKSAKLCLNKEQISGIYEATISCEDCKRAISSLELYNNGNFRLETIVEKKSTQTTIEDGIYTIKNDEITLTNQYREKAKYKFDNENLILLDDDESFVKNIFMRDLVYKRLK